MTKSNVVPLVREEGAFGLGLSTTPPTPTIDRWHDRLSKLRCEFDPFVGKTIIEGEVAPLLECAQMQSELAYLQQPMRSADTVKLARVLITAYPACKPAEPKIYVRLMADAFAGYPLHAGITAVRTLLHELKFPPTPADVYQALEHAMSSIEGVEVSIQWHIKANATAYIERAKSEWQDRIRAARPEFEAMERQCLDRCRKEPPRDEREIEEHFNDMARKRRMEILREVLAELANDVGDQWPMMEQKVKDGLRTERAAQVRGIVIDRP